MTSDAGAPTSPNAAAQWDKKYEDSVRSAWTKNKIVERELYMRMTDLPQHWIDWTFQVCLPPIERILSVGCGDGSHELAIGRRKFASDIRAFDASPVAIEQAKAGALAEGLEIDFQVSTFEEFSRSEPSGPLMDAVMFCGSLHHVTEIEAMLFAVRRHLRPGGFIIINEYVGPCYQLYSERQVSIVNNFLTRIPAAFKIAPDVQLTLPTIEMIMAADPTEGVRANLIRPLLPLFFNPHYERLVGGGLLHPIFGLLDDNQINDGSAASEAVAELLVAADSELTRLGILDHEFLFSILTNPG